MYKNLPSQSAYCSKSTESNGKTTLMCLNPFHYEMVMELNIFAEKLTQIVTEGNEHTMTKMELNALMMWARDIHKA